MASVSQSVSVTDGDLTRQRQAAGRSSYRTLLLTVEPREAAPPSAFSSAGSSARVRPWVLATALWSICTGLR